MTQPRAPRTVFDLWLDKNGPAICHPCKGGQHGTGCDMFWHRVATGPFVIDYGQLACGCTVCHPEEAA